MTTTVEARHRSWRKTRRVSGRVSLNLFIAIAAIVYLVPLLFVLSSSLRLPESMHDPAQWLPVPATLDHFVRLIESNPLLPRYVWNTVVISVLSTVGTLFSSALAGYGLARFRFPGRAVILSVLLLTLMVPPQVTLVPTYTAFRYLGLVDSPWPLIIPALFGAPFVTVFFRQYFIGLSKEFDEAARVDGASWWQVFWYIVVPLSRPAFVTMGLLTLIGQWNGFFGPSIYLQSREQWVLSQAIVALSGQYVSDEGAIMAGIILMSLPMVVLFAVAQKWIVQGVASSGVKG